MKIAVVGMGHVGMPLASVLALSSGTERVFCVDIDTKTTLERFRALETLQDEPGLLDNVKRAAGMGKLKVADFSCCSDVNAVLICVPTPVDITHSPDYSALASAVTRVAKHIVDGILVVVESTIAPGTMESLVVPILEEYSGLKDGISLYVAHCPERISPSRALHSLTNNPRVIGCTTEAAREFVYDVYSNLGTQLYFTDAKTAEVTKTAENAYRDVQLAFTNELADICQQHGVDAWEVRKCVNTCPGRNVLWPGIGVGGHCIPKDPWLLMHGIEHMPLVTAARRTNGYATERAAKFIESLYPNMTPWGTLEVLMLGVAYKANVGDVRNSPSLALGTRLQVESSRHGSVNVRYHDPYVPGYQRKSLEDHFTGANIAILAVPHKEYYACGLHQYASLMDTTGGILVNCCKHDISWPRGYYRLYDKRG